MVQGALFHLAEGVFARTLGMEELLSTWTATDHPIREVPTSKEALPMQTIPIN